MDKGLQRRSLSLKADEIDGFLEWVNETSMGLGVERQNRMRTSLIIEEMLLRMRDRFGEDVPVSASYDARLRRLRHPRLQIEVEGEPFNPLGMTTGELGEWSSSLCTAIGLIPQYSYEWGRNILRLQVPSPGMSSVFWIVVAILLGVSVGLMGEVLVPSSIRERVTGMLLGPTYAMWLRMLNALSGPVIFLTVVTTMINTRGIVERGGSSLLVIVRYFVISVLDVMIALACSIPLRLLGHKEMTVDYGLAGTLYDEVLQVIPGNVLDPFIEANTPQLLFLGLILGFVLMRSGDGVAGIRKLFREANMIGLRLASWMGMLVPFVVGVFVCLEFWQGKTGMLLGLWQPLLHALVLSIATMALVILPLAWRMRVAPWLIIQKLWPTFATTLRTGSLDEAFGLAQDCCIQLLGIERGHTRVALPQGLVLYMPISAVGTFVYTIYAARQFNLQVNLMWYVMAVILVVSLFVATPPVPGANLLAYVMLFSALHIPGDALLDAMTFDILFGIFAGAANQALLQLEMVYQANRFGLLDIEALRNPVS